MRVVSDVLDQFSVPPKCGAEGEESSVCDAIAARADFAAIATFTCPGASGWSAHRFITFFDLLYWKGTADEYVWFAFASEGPMLLRGERSLTAHHARLLGEHFKVDPGVFIR